MNNRKILIAGGGIGGLTAAIALRQRGFAVEVFEQADELREIGAGLSLWPNATRVLARLGLLEEACARSAAIERLQLKTWRGELLSEMTNVARYDTPSICIHRADLHSLLKAQLPPDGVRLGERIESFAERDGRVMARTARGLEAEGDALIGADGLRSATRAQLLGPALPVYRGYFTWRAIARFAWPAHLPLAGCETWGRGLRFGMWAMSRERVYWYAAVNAPAEREGSPAAWKDEAAALFKDWHAPIPEIIAATEPEAILKHDILDRPPAPRWGEGRVTLLGDAAHPTTPNLGQGACLAIEDAWTLAKHLADEADIPTALRRYEAARARRTSFIVREARMIGWLGQWENPLAVALRNAWVKLSPSSLMERRQRAYYSFEP